LDNSKINAIKELIDFENDLSQEEKEETYKNLDDIITKTPRSKIASMKFKLTLTKIGKETAKAIRDILVDIGS
jgi:hypothetical protein